MRFTINKEKFLKALNAASHGVAVKSPNPVLSNVKLDLNEKGLEITGSNAELAIRVTIPYMEGETEIIRNASVGKTLVNARNLTEFIRRVDVNEVSIEVIDDSIAKVDGGRSSIKLNSINADEYPDIDFDVTGQVFDASCADIALLVDQSAFAASTKEQRPVLAAVKLEAAGNGQLVAIATDSARLACKTIHISQDVHFCANVPARVLSDIVRLFENEPNVRVGIDDHKALFQFGNTIVTSRLIPGDHPGNKSIIPTSFNYFLEVNSQEFLSAIGRVCSILSADRDSAVKLLMREDEVEVQAKSESNGSANESIQTFSYSGERLEVSFNPVFVMDAIRALKSEDVTLCFQSEMKPFVAKNVKDPSAIEIITPMRTY